MNDYSQFIEACSARLGPESLRREEPMRNHTTWRVGGSADLFFVAKTQEDLVTIITLARQFSIPYFVLGAGSNILVGDKGVRGLVVWNRVKSYEFITDPEIVHQWQDHQSAQARHKAIHYHYYDERNSWTNAEYVFVKVSSGYTMAQFIKDMLAEGITGLEYFTRIPGTLGGWIYNNAHAKDVFIGDYILNVTYLDETSKVQTGLWNELDLNYDYSMFHERDCIILGAILRLYRGDVVLAQEIADKVNSEKSLHQASNSAGSTFHNIPEEDAKRCGFESVGVGYVVDKIFGWNGKQRVGGAWISEKNGNFIETDTTATAQDVIAVMDIIKKEFKDRYNIDIKEEIFRVGEF